MRVLTLTQPWASLVAIGAKQFETRSWGTSFRGRLAIHAAKGFPRWAQALCYQEPFRSSLLADGMELFVQPDEQREYPAVSTLPRGQIIAMCHLVSAVPIEKSPWVIGEREAAFGEYRAGRFVWYLDDVRRFAEPIPARGKLGLWTFDHPALEQLATADVARMA